MERPLWANIASCLADALGEAVHHEGELGVPRPTRKTWAARAEQAGPLVVKVRYSDRAEEKTRWAARHLPLLRARGYPVPELLWHGSVSEEWYVAVFTRLPGQSLRALEPGMVEQLLELVELQAEAGVAAETRDMAEYHALVLFDGWEGWWRDAETATAESAALCTRLRRWLAPIWGHRIGGRDFANNDLNLTNVLIESGTVSGVVDWDEFGINTRAADLAAIAYDCARWAGPAASRPVLARIRELVGEEGERTVLSYRALAHIATLARRRQVQELESMVAIAERVLDEVAAPASGNQVRTRL